MVLGLSPETLTRHLSLYACEQEHGERSLDFASVSCEIYGFSKTDANISVWLHTINEFHMICIAKINQTSYYVKCISNQYKNCDIFCQKCSCVGSYVLLQHQIFR